MSLQIMSASPVEAEIYSGVPAIRQVIDLVGNMVMDLHEDDPDLTILYVMDDPDDPRTFTLAFSGSTLSLEFSEDAIEVWDFNEEGGERLAAFGDSAINEATLWLVNRLK